MTSRMRNIAGGAILVCASIIFALLIGEAALRLFPGFLPEGAAIRLHWAEQVEESPPSPHPYIGFVPRPEGFREGEDASTASAEAIWGQRNLPPWPEHADVVVVGDSFSYSQTVDLKEAWTVLVDKALPNNRVVTLATIGSGPQQYSRVLETYGIPLSPKVVLVGLFMGNDMFDAEVFDRWEKDAGNVDYRKYRMHGEASSGYVFLRRISEKSYLAALLRDALRSRNLDETLKGKTVELESGERLQLVPRYVEIESARAVKGDPGFDATVRSIYDIGKIASSNDVACLVILFPTKEEVYSDFLEQDFSRLEDAMKGELDKLGINYLDLGPILRLKAREGRALYHEVDGHPNALGYDVIAQAIVDHLRTNSDSYGLTLKDSKEDIGVRWPD